MVAQMILRNLIENLMRVSSDDLESGQVSLSVSVSQGGGSVYKVTIEDRSDGSNPEAFDVLNTGNLQSESGSGLLGARRLVHARGGSLSCRTSGGSAAVSLSLPGVVVRSGEKQAALRL